MEDTCSDRDARTRIIDATCRILAEKGRTAATIKEIARVAEIAPGLVYYYFDDKDELFLAVLGKAARRGGEEFGCAVDPSPTARTFHPILPATAEETPSQRPDQIRLRYELFALGLSHPKFLPALGEILVAGRRSLETQLHSNGDTSSVTPALSAVLLACLDGLALQKVADPDFDLADAFDRLETMVKTCR